MSAEQLNGFEDYIERNQLVSAKYARYHRMWVERWLAFAGPAAGEDPDAARRRYLEPFQKALEDMMPPARYPDSPTPARCSGG